MDKILKELSNELVNNVIYMLNGNRSSVLSSKELLEEYIRFGGFPIIALSEYEPQSVYQIVNGIYYTVVSRDIVKRHRINKKVSG